MRSAALAALACLVAGCGAADPCDGVAGACVSIFVEGDVGAVDQLHIDVSGALAHSFTRPVASGLPVSVALLVPDAAQGQLAMVAVASHAGATVALGKASTQLSAGAHARVDITLARVGAGSCSDGARDGNETDVDCGGTCPACGDGQACASGKDCASGSCVAARCAAAACSDGVRNGSETDVDCGGSCPQCGDSHGCTVAKDCVSGVCGAGRCAAPACSDGVKNGSESDVDCGGACSGCPDDKACTVAHDCLSGACLLMRCAPRPTLTAVMPPVGPTAGGTLVTVTGDHFAAGATLTFDGRPAANVTFVSAQQLTATLPPDPGKLGPVAVVVTNPSSLTATASNLFSYELSASGYNTGTGYGVGQQATFSTVVDLDGDGHADLSVATADSLFVMLGRGDGSFAQPVGYPYGAVLGATDGAGAGDFDGDGKLDVIVAASDISDLALLLGNGDGTFKSARIVPQPCTAPRSPVVADFNSDGHADVAVVCNAAGGVSTLVILLWDVTSRSLVTAIAYTDGSYASGLASADFNHDGKVDLALATGNASTVDVWLGQGGGAFSLSNSYQVTSNVVVVATIDLNGDGWSDVVAAAPNHTGGAVAVLLNDKTGSLSKPVYYAATAGYALTVGDFDGDGKPDVAVGGSSSADRYSVLLGNGQGAFGPATTYAAPYPLEIVAGDWNQDGRADLAQVLAPSTGRGIDTVGVYLADVGGRFPAPARYPVLGGAPASVHLADIDGDGKLDLVAAGAQDGAVSIRLGKGDGTFGAEAALMGLGLIAGQDGLAVGDVNSDGRPDLVVTWGAMKAAVSLCLGVGDGTFSAPATIPLGAGAQGALVAIGDFVGDAHPDLAVSTTSGLALLAGDGAGGFGAAALAATAGGARGDQLISADWNADGRADLAYAVAGAARVFLSQRGGGFAPAVDDTGLGVTTFGLAPGDFDGDGRPDLVITSDSDDALGWLRGDGVGGLSLLSQVTLGHTKQASETPLGVVALDVTRDGRLDAAAVLEFLSTVSVASGHGDGTFATPRNYLVGLRPVAIAAGDLNGDGLPDLVVADAGDGDVTVLVNTSR